MCGRILSPPLIALLVLSGLALALGKTGGVAGASARAPSLSAKSEDISPYLPDGARLEQRLVGDTDGDVWPDEVVLYSVVSRVVGQRPSGMFVLRGPPQAREAAYLLGSREDADGPPVYGGPSEPYPTTIELQDLTGDGPSEIVLRWRGRTSALWVFRWDGAAYRLEARLLGVDRSQTVEDTAAGPGFVVRKSGGTRDGDITWGWKSEDHYLWRANGYRHALSRIELDGDPTPHLPWLAVLKFYQAIDRGDPGAAYALLTDTARAATPYHSFVAQTALLHRVRVEEVREYASTAWSNPYRVQSVYVRISFEHALGGAMTHAGTWQARPVGNEFRDGFRLEAPFLRPAPEQLAIAERLPAGASIKMTALGALSGPEWNDIGVVYQPPVLSEYARSPEPAVLIGAPGGPGTVYLRDLEPPPTSRYDPGFGEDPTVLRIEDVNADGRAELVYASRVGNRGTVLRAATWDGQQLALLIRDSGIIGLGLEDLDGDGVQELLYSSSTCANADPGIRFARRWRDGQYRAASSEFPGLYSGQDLVQPQGWADALRAGKMNDRAACTHFLLATVRVLQGRLSEGWQEYQEYHRARMRGTAGRGGLPAYIEYPTFQDEIRAVQSRVLAGEFGPTAPSERALLFDLLGNAQQAWAERLRFLAGLSAKDGLSDQADNQLRQAEAADLQAAESYRAALALDSSDGEAAEALKR